ncbi:MAG: OFA family MFS transporter [Candidatus Bathyarchaeia archaeon]
MDNLILVMEGGGITFKKSFLKPNQTGHRWLLLSAALVTMMVISIYQYSWSLFATGLNVELKWEMTVIQLAFVLFTYAATFVQPFSGWFADKYNSRNTAMLGSLLTFLGFSACSIVNSPLTLYLYYTLGSVGVGILYGLCTAVAVKWFPDRRGLATGLVTFGFGGGTMFFNLLIQSLISTYGVKNAFLYVSIIMLVATMPFAIICRFPDSRPQQVSGQPLQISEKMGNERDWVWFRMIRTYQWWLIYITFTVIAAIALLFGAQIKPLAIELKIPESTLNLTLVLFPLANGFSRILGGWLSDRIGRQVTATLFYALSGIFMVLLGFFGSSAFGFSIFVTLSILFAGAVFAFNPLFIGEFYGSRYATVNYGITYTAKSWGGLIAGYLTSWLQTTFGSYSYSILALGAAALISAALVNPYLLKNPKEFTKTEIRKSSTNLVEE